LHFSVLDLIVTGSSEDLSRSVLWPAAPWTAYRSDDPRSNHSEGSGGANSYLVDSSGEPTIELLARDKDDKVFGGRCGSYLGGDDSTFNQGAISPDGQRIFFTTRPAQPWDSEAVEGPSCDSNNPLRILERTETSEGPVISEPIPGGPSAPGDDLFEAASADGTKIYFTTDTSSGVVGGDEGAQGGVSTVDGKASVLIATDPGNAGTHTVIAYALKGNADSDVVAQTSETYVCDGAVAPAAPTVNPPSTGTGTGNITPPNTGDAGLAAGSSSSASLFVIAGAVAFVLAGLASVRFARN
jgi:hypothetical protein